MMRIKASKLRALVIAAVAVIIVVDLVSRTGTGTISVFGYKKIAAVCPLGSIESLLASKTFLPLAVISFLVLLAIAIVIGRIFCAWICPIPSPFPHPSSGGKNNGNPSPIRLLRAR